MDLSWGDEICLKVLAMEDYTGFPIFVKENPVKTEKSPYNSPT